MTTTGPIDTTRRDSTPEERQARAEAYVTVRRKLGRPVEQWIQDVADGKELAG